jgi:hypothetical protein
MSELVGAEFENVLLFLLSEPKTSAHRAFEEVAFKELAEASAPKAFSPLLVALSHKMELLSEMQDSRMRYTAKPDEEDSDCVE